ncbi:hypothetical protein BKA66DRAFT_25789 [Pyrenochaeta sp. MPI-SDFR-AT-0127]|nr:hypothetical protein BKA66DRAFT_25789 [Pyrenochaeta sp. MPI-SDFR-AT-0127]
MKNILILGGSYAGISTAHRILKSKTGLEPFKITLVSPNTHFYWNIASPRGIIPGQLTDEQLFQPIANGFDHYSTGNFEFIQGSADSMDLEGQNMVIDSSGGKMILHYDFLIVATGTRMREMVPFKGIGSTEQTKELLHDFQKKVQNAKTIVVAGAGVTGVEIAGELSYEYGGEKQITLLSSTSTIIHEAPPSVSNLATTALKDLQVSITYNTKVLKSSLLPKGGQELMLSSGETILADLYIPTFGLLPNSSYIPAHFLNATGFVTVDENLNIKGTTNVWALGDVADVEYCQFASCNRQSIHVAKSIVAALNGRTTAPYKATTTRFMGFQIGKKSGTGHYGNWRLPSFVVVWVRRNLFLHIFGPIVDGSWF